MTSPRSGLPEESAARQPDIATLNRHLEKLRAAVREGVGSVRMPTPLLVEICETHVALRSLLSDRDETIKALRADNERMREQLHENFMDRYRKGEFK